MDMMMTSNSSKNGDNNNNTIVAFTHHQQYQHQQVEEAVGVVASQVVEARHVDGENKKPRPPLLDEPLRCPRCDSDNTKFCYYNNYSLSQPRYHCKACRRYWTQGGSLRDVPIGGRPRKNKRASAPLPSSSSGSSSIGKEHHLVPMSHAAKPQDVLPTNCTAEPPQDFPNVLPTFMSGSFEMPPFTPMSLTPAPPLPSDVENLSFLDILGEGVLNHEGNNFYGPTSNGMMDMPLFGSGTGRDTIPIGGGNASTHEGGQVAGAGEQYKGASVPNTAFQKA